MALGVEIAVNFEQYSKVNEKLKDLLRKLEKSNSLNVSVSQESLNKIQTQIDALQSKMANGAKKTGKEIGDAISQGTATEPVKKLNQSVNDTSKAMNSASHATQGFAKDFQTALEKFPKMYGEMMA